MTSDGKLTLMAVGDIHIKRPDPLSIFGDTAEVLARADVLLGNQEGPVSDRGEPLLAKRSVGSVCLRAPVGSIAAEAEIGFSAMTLANNHTMDYGPEALLQTRDLLHAHGIATAGAGADAKEAHTPAIIECNGVRIAMLGYTSVFPVSGFAAGDGQPGVATVRVSTSYQAPPSVPYQPGTPAVTLTVPQGDDMRQMADDIAGAADDADLVVVQFHWGVAGYAHPIGYMKEMARFAVDAGADLILGNHAHVLQGLEVYRDALICYCLNHFAFETNPGRTVAANWPTGDESLILQSEIRDKAFVRHSLGLAVLDEENNNLKMADAERRASITQTLEELSEDFGTVFRIEGDQVVVEGPAPGTPPALRSPDVLADPARFVLEGMKLATVIHDSTR